MNSLLKIDFKKTIKDVMKSRWILVLFVIVGYMAYTNSVKSLAVDVSRGYEGATVNVSKEINWYNDAVDSYEDKTGDKLPSSGVTYTTSYLGDSNGWKPNTYGEEDNGVETNSQVSLKHFMDHPLILQDQGYRLQGIIVKKLRLVKGPVDIMTIRTKYGIVKIFYQGGLPNPIRGEKVSITGTVLGNETFNGDVQPVMVSSRSATKLISK